MQKKVGAPSMEVTAGEPLEDLMQEMKRAARRCEGKGSLIKGLTKVKGKKLFFINMFEEVCFFVECANAESKQVCFEYGGEFQVYETQDLRRSAKSVVRVINTDFDEYFKESEVEKNVFSDMNHLNESKGVCLDSEGEFMEKESENLKQVMFHIQSDEAKVYMNFVEEGLDMKGTRLNSLYTFFGYKTKCVKENEIEEDGSLKYGWTDLECALLGEKQDDVFECWMRALERKTWAAYYYKNEGPLAEMFSKGGYFEDEEGFWWQHDQIPMMIPNAAEHYYIAIMFERNGVSYLSNIMQNYIFDPGGTRTLAHT